MVLPSFQLFRQRQFYNINVKNNRELGVGKQGYGTRRSGGAVV